MVQPCVPSYSIFALSPHTGTTSAHLPRRQRSWTLISSSCPLSSPLLALASLTAFRAYPLTPQSIPLPACLYPPSPSLPTTFGLHTFPNPANLAFIHPPYTIHNCGAHDFPLLMNYPSPSRSLDAHVPISPPPTLPTATHCLPEVDNEVLGVHLNDRSGSEPSPRPHLVHYRRNPDLELMYGEDPCLDCDQHISLQLSPLSPQCPSRIMGAEMETPALVTFHDSTDIFTSWQSQREAERHPETEITTPSLSALPSPPRSPSSALTLGSMDEQDLLPPSPCSCVPSSAEKQVFEIGAPSFVNSIETDVIASRWQPSAGGLSTPPPSSKSVLAPVLPYPADRSTSLHMNDHPTFPIIPPLPPPLDDMPEPLHAHFDSSFLNFIGPMDPLYDGTEYTEPAPDQLESDPGFEATHNESIFDRRAYLSYESPILESQNPSTSNASNSLPFRPISIPDHPEVIVPSSIPPAQSPSPSRRRFSSLPELDIPEDFPSPIYNPTPHHILALPGVDPDHDLIPPDHSDPSSSSSFTLPTQANGTSLLFINDPNDIPPPRSPSPENLDLDGVPDDAHADPDFARLCALRKRVIAAERTARALEAQMLNKGDVYLRAEARRVRKREKERSREVGALLRLKLGDRIRQRFAGITVPSHGGDMSFASASSESSASNEGSGGGEGGATLSRMINSLSQLVARMKFRRNEPARVLANRKMDTGARPGYVPSPLWQSIIPDDDEEEEEGLLSVQSNDVSVTSGLASFSINDDCFREDVDCKIATTHAL